MSAYTEYLNERRHIAFPFTDDASGLDRGSGGLPLGLVVDALFTVPWRQADTQLYLGGISVEDSFLKLHITDGVEVVLTVPVYSLWSTWWTGSTTNVSVGEFTGLTGTIVCDPVLGQAAMVAYADVPGEFGTSLPFTASVMVQDEPRLRSITGYNYVRSFSGLGSWNTIGTVSGDVMLKAGHNIDLQVQTPDATGATPVRLSASPGAGIGKVPCPGAVITGIMKGVNPLHGDVQIEADDCYQIVPMPDPYPPGTFQVQGRCQACCTCGDYADMSAELAAIADRLRGVKQSLDDGREMYQAGVTQFNDVIIPAIGSVTLSVSMLASHVQWNRIRVGLQITNKRTNSVTLNSWGCTFPAGGLTYDETVISFRNTGTRTTIGGIPAGYNVIAPGETLTITMLVHKDLTAWGPSSVWTGTATAQTTEAVTNAVDSLSKVWRLE